MFKSRSTQEELRKLVQVNVKTRYRIDSKAWVFSLVVARYTPNVPRPLSNALEVFHLNLLSNVFRIQTMRKIESICPSKVEQVLGKSIVGEQTM